MSKMNECPKIKGKTVAACVRNRPANAPVVLGECGFEVREGRLFLVGTSLAAQRSTEAWTDGVRRAVAWDAIDEYLLFDSPDDYYARRSVGAAEMDESEEMPHSAQGIPGMPMMEAPGGPEGYPLEPSGIQMQPETPLEIGSTVLSYSQGRWWRAEVVGIEEDDMVRIHFPGWDEKWDVTIPKTELQVDLAGSIEADE
jgi:hypothetical protein